MLMGFMSPNMEHKLERYDDPQTDLYPSIFISLEQHLTPSMLELQHDVKAQFMEGDPCKVLVG